MPRTKKAEPSTISFGKYKGQPVEALLADTDYARWCRTEDGVMQRLRKKHPLVFLQILSANPTPTATKPEEPKPAIESAPVSLVDSCLDHWRRTIIETYAIWSHIIRDNPETLDHTCRGEMDYLRKVRTCLESLPDNASQKEKALVNARIMHLSDNHLMHF
jgi:hypothetical protein